MIVIESVIKLRCPDCHRNAMELQAERDWYVCQSCGREVSLRDMRVLCQDDPRFIYTANVLQKPM